MTSTDIALGTLLASYWQDHGLFISSDLIDHEEFLLNFIPTGNIEDDIAVFMTGVGRDDMMLPVDF
jgi:hypothetical protein